MKTTSYSRKPDAILGSLEPDTIILNTPRSLLVSSGFRDWFLDYFKLKDPDGSIPSDKMKLLRLAGYLLSHPGLKDPYGEGQDGSIPVGRDTLREVMKPGCKDNNFGSGEALVSFRKAMWDLKVQPANHHMGQVACVKHQSFPEDLRLKFRAELKPSLQSNFVDLVTGRPHDSQPNRIQRCSSIKEVETLRQGLNELPESLFEPVKASVQKAKEFVLRQEWSVHTMLRELSILRQVEADPRPLYKAVTATSRLYNNGATWLSLKRATREQVTGSYWKLDLKAAQLRIAASLWGFDLTPYEGDGIWNYLLNSLGYRSTKKSVKDQLKTFVYACLFGMSEHNLKDLAMELMAPELMKNPLIVDILAARKRVVARLEAGEVFSDAWGSKHKVSEKTSGKRSKQIRSIMAAVCQSYELKLLIPLIDLANERGCTTVAILHDCIYGTGDWEPILGDLEGELRKQAQTHLSRVMDLDISAPKIVEVLPKAA